MKVGDYGYRIFNLKGTQFYRYKIVSIDKPSWSENEYAHYEVDKIYYAVNDFSLKKIREPDSEVIQSVITDWDVALKRFKSAFSISTHMQNSTERDVIKYLFENNTFKGDK